MGSSVSSSAGLCSELMSIQKKVICPKDDVLGKKSYG